jgi:hypothetical protein
VKNKVIFLAVLIFAPNLYAADAGNPKNSRFKMIVETVIKGNRDFATKSRDEIIAQIAQLTQEKADHQKKLDWSYRSQRHHIEDMGIFPVIKKVGPFLELPNKSEETLDGDRAALARYDAEQKELLAKITAGQRKIAYLTYRTSPQL